MKKDKKSIEEFAALFGLIGHNFSVFTSEIMGLDNAQFHNELDDCLSNERYKKLCIAVARGHGKTTHLSIAYPLWEIAKNHNVRILLVSSTAQVTKDSLGAIISNIDQNERYQMWAKAIDSTHKGITPKLKGRQKREAQWTGDAITVSRTDLKLKDPTISAVGLFGSILSKRADIIIVDDLVNQENSATEEQRRKIKEWVYTTLLPVLVPGGRFIYLGNTWHMDDLMSNLLKDPQFDIKKRLPAITHEASRQDFWETWASIHLDESLRPEEKQDKAEKFYADNQKEMDKGIEVLWPERYSYQDLYLKRVANPYSFARMYQCDPSIRPNQKFQESDIELALRKGANLMLQDSPRSELEMEMTASGLDLAISQSSHSDDTALLTLEKVKYGSGDIKNGDFIVRNIRRGKFLPKEVRIMVIEHYKTVKPDGIRVESVGYQESMSRDLGDNDIPVTSYHTGGEKNDSDIGVNSLATLLGQGKLILPFSNSDARTRQLITQLVNEMRAYPEGHTGDSLMALWFAYSEIRDYTTSRLLTPTPEPPKQQLSQKELEKEADLIAIIEQEAKRGRPITKQQARELCSRRQTAKMWDREWSNAVSGMMGG